MKVKAPVCAKCNADLVDKTVDVKGKQVDVCECPKCKGQIEAPRCCDATMEYR